MKRSAVWLSVLVAALLAFAGCRSESSGPRVGTPDKTEAGRISLMEKQMSASLVGGNLEVRIPLVVEGNKSVKGSFDLTIRHLDGDWSEVATGIYEAAPGVTTVVATFERTPPLDGTGDQSAYVLDYIIDTPDGTLKGFRSLFALLPKINVMVYTPQNIFPSQKSLARVIVSNPITDQPVPNTLVTVILTDTNGDDREMEVTTDEFGTGIVDLKTDVEGEVQVKAFVMTDDGEEQAEGVMQVVRESRVLVTTDKPLYQPGQKMYVRALALEKPDLTPEAGKELLFEIQDAKGNKVFKQAVQTNEFGVAATEFTLATQVNMGAYKIIATLDDVATEKTVTVDRYSLPKFKVTSTLDKTFYMPGETIHGEILAEYFFGKTVAGGQVEVTVFKYEAEWTPDQIITGQTNDAGLYVFDYDLPDYVVGQPLDQGKALVLMEIAVTDLASQKVVQAKNILVTDALMDIALLPESGTVVPDVPNAFFLFVSDPTGGPVAATATLTINGAEFDDDEIEVGDDGLATFTLTPHQDVLEVDVAAEGAAGEASASFSYNVGDFDQSVLVRTDKAVYEVGETIEVSIHTSGGHNRVFFDVIRKNQTVLTQTIDIEGGFGATFLDIDNSMTEDLVLEAYFLADTGQFIRDGKIVYVEPATNLTVTMTPDKDTYLPGEQAVLNYEVKDQDGAPAQAALGIQVVDEAVFALSEMKPGLLKLYFQLEAELSDPSYQVGPGTGSTFGQLLTQKDQIVAGSPEEDSWQAAAGASLAALGDVPSSQSAFSSWEASQFELDDVLEPFYTERSDQIVSDLGKLSDAGVFTMENIDEYFEKNVADYFDFWGNPYRITITGEDTWDMQILVASDGPDEKEGTWDDWVAELQIGEVVRQHGGGGWGEDGDFNMAGGMEAGVAMDDEEGARPPNAEDPSDKSDGDEESGDSSVKVRSWFPETLFVEPSLITEADGTASVTVPLADSITQWRVSTMANSADGKLGSAADGVVVFQDFFVDIDFPKYLTRGDEIAFPIAVYNYLETSQNVEIEVIGDEWFEMAGGNTINLTLGPQEVTGVTFPVTVTKVGWHALTVYGHGSQMSDAVQRIVEVKPDGKEMLHTAGAKFTGSPEPGQSVEDHAVETVVVPDNSIENSESLVVQIHPGFSSQVVGGMDSMLKLPGGCFEQTTSSAWPNVLAINYMIETETITPEIEMKAMEYINVGYQRILTFECASGGFNWWEGDDPGNAILGAVSVMMLTDTKDVYGSVDQAVIDRTADWLVSVQKSDGSWTEDKHLHAGNENLGTGSLRATCYIAWALAHGGYPNQQATTFIDQNIGAESDFYTKTMCANALAVAGGNGPTLQGLLSDIDGAKIVEDDMVRWAASGSTLVNSGGNAADVEVTSLAALAFIHSGAYPSNVTGAVNWLITTKDPQGNWGYNTQATVLALKTFIGAATANPGPTSATVSVYLNGDQLGTMDFDDFNKDVVWQVESYALQVGENVLELDYQGFGNLSYQIVAKHHVPWEDAGIPPDGPISIDISYDKTQLSVDDQVTATVTVTAKSDVVQGTVLVDLGLPPGFQLEIDDLVAQKQEKVISEFEVTGKQLILYLDELTIGEPRIINYKLTALYPLTAQTGGSQAYAYYNAEVKDEEEPTEFEVTD